VIAAEVEALRATAAAFDSEQEVVAASGEHRADVASSRARD
jgi:hypothetical protein